MADVFLVAVPFMAVAFVIALTMREKPLRSRAAPNTDSATPSASDGTDLVSMAH
jgi:hypothetical protein